MNKIYSMSKLLTTLLALAAVGCSKEPKLTRLDCDVEVSRIFGRQAIESKGKTLLTVTELESGRHTFESDGPAVSFFFAGWQVAEDNTFSNYTSKDEWIYFRTSITGGQEGLSIFHLNRLTGELYYKSGMPNGEQFVSGSCEKAKNQGSKF